MSPEGEVELGVPEICQVELSPAEGIGKSKSLKPGSGESGSYDDAVEADGRLTARKMERRVLLDVGNEVLYKPQLHSISRSRWEEKREMEMERERGRERMMDSRSSKVFGANRVNGGLMDAWEEYVFIVVMSCE